MTLLSTDLSLSSDLFIFNENSGGINDAIETMKAALASAGEEHRHAHVEQAAKVSEIGFEQVLMPDTLIATYTSGIQKVKFKENFVEYRENGEKFKKEYDDPDLPDNLEDPYNIELAFFGEGWSEELLDVFVAASEFLSDMIAAGLPEDMVMSTTTGEMIEVDDLRIEASLSQGDGIGGIVGGAEIEAVRSSDGVTPDGLPVLSLMNFDVDDANALLEQGIWDDLVLHEMFHAMGFGSPPWSADNVSGENYFALAQLPGLPFPVAVGDPIYQNLDETGQNTTRVAEVAAAEGTDTSPSLSGFAAAPFINGQIFDEFAFLISANPLDSLGHWDEAEYGNALMTPVLSHEENVLLDITLASMEDLGYELMLDLVAEDNPLSEGIDLVAENNVKFSDFAEDVLMLG